MSMETTTAKRVVCPACRTKGRRIAILTLQSLLKPEAIATLEGIPAAGDCSGSEEGCQTPSEDTGWRFCDSQECDVVYFAEEGDATFGKSDLTVSVGVKETSGERPLCYCFGHSVASIKDELRADGRTNALEDIRANMKDPGCHCETANPSGSCCLGSVTQGIKISQEELGISDSDVPPPVTPKSSTGRGEKIAKVGTLVSAIMASSCCWLPLLLLAVGVSGAGIASALEEFRPYFMVVTFGFLGAAFYFTYRPKKAAVDGGGDCCAPEPAAGDDCCAPTGNGRFNMMTLNKAMLWGVTVMAVVFLFFPSYVGVFFGTGSDVVTDDMNRVIFQIEGMTCEGCSTTFAQAIRQVPGVLAVEVSYEKKQAIVGIEATRPILNEEVLAALNEVGYGGTLFGEEGTETGEEATTQNENEAPPDSATVEVSQDLTSLSACTLSVSGMT